MSASNPALLVRSFSCPATSKNIKAITKEFLSSTNNIVSILTAESQIIGISEWCL